MSETRPDLPNRLASIDAYRGLVLALMMGEALHFCLVSAARPALAGRVNAITELYIALRYGSPAGHKALDTARLQRMVRRFPARWLPDWVKLA